MEAHIWANSLSRKTRSIEGEVETVLLMLRQLGSLSETLRAYQYLDEHTDEVLVELSEMLIRIEDDIVRLRHLTVDADRQLRDAIRAATTP